MISTIKAISTQFSQSVIAASLATAISFRATIVTSANAMLVAAPIIAEYLAPITSDDSLFVITDDAGLYYLTWS